MSAGSGFVAGGGGDDGEEDGDGDTVESTDDEGTTSTGGLLTSGGGETLTPDEAEQTAQEAQRAGRTRTEARNTNESRARSQVASQSELIDPSDVVFVDRPDGTTVATVDEQTARTLGAVGFGQGQEFIQEGGRVGETGGGEDAGFQGGLRGPPEEDGLLMETGGGEDFGVQGGDIVSQVEGQISRQLGQRVDLDRSDIEIAADGSVSLTQAGASKVAAAQAGGDFPGEGSVLNERQRRRFGQSRDFGGVEIRIPLFADSPALGTQVGSVTFDEVLENIENSILGATELQDPAVLAGEPRPGRAGAALRQEQREFTGVGSRPVQQFSQDLLRSPLLLTGGAGFLKDVAEFDLEVREAILERDIERLQELEQDVVDVATEQAVLTGATAARDPGQFAARGLGTLAGSALLFGGARAIGPRTSLATRGVIQPGEELLGVGGHAVTRRVAGRGAAERLFPNQEPLIFSEEAALRNLRRAGGRTAEAAERAVDVIRRTEVSARPGAGLGGLRFETRQRSELEQEIDEEIDDALREFERAESIRRANARAEEGTRRRREAGRRLTEAEEPSLPERHDVFVSEPRGGEFRSDPSGRQAQRVRLRQQVQEEARARQARAEAPSVETEQQAELDRAVETALGELTDELMSEEVLDAVLERGEQGEREVVGADTEEDVEQLFEPVDVEAEVEDEFEFPEFELEGEIENETGEIESEIENFIEGESEAEVEIFDEVVVERRREEDIYDDLFADEIFASGIADVEDLESGLVDDFEDAEEGLFDGSFEDIENEVLEDFDL